VCRFAARSTPHPAPGGDPAAVGGGDRKKTGRSAGPGGFGGAGARPRRPEPAVQGAGRPRAGREQSWSSLGRAIVAPRTGSAPTASIGGGGRAGGETRRWTGGREAQGVRGSRSSRGSTRVEGHVKWDAPERTARAAGAGRIGSTRKKRRSRGPEAGVAHPGQRSKSRPSSTIGTPRSAPSVGESGTTSISGW